jgi:hypothetical protein
LKLDDLPRTAKKSLPKRNAKRQRATQKPELTNYPTSKRLTLELSGRCTAAFRLNDWLARRRVTCDWVLLLR